MTGSANQGRNGQTPPAVHARADLDNTNTGAASLAPGGGGGSHPAAPATLTIDDPDNGGSDPGSYAQHLRDVECMGVREKK